MSIINSPKGKLREKNMQAGTSEVRLTPLTETVRITESPSLSSGSLRSPQKGKTRRSIEPIRDDSKSLSTNEFFNFDQLRERRKQTNRELLRKTRRLSMILDVVEEAVFTIDENERINFYNRACKDMLGYVEGDLLGQSVWEIFNSKTADHIRSLIRANDGTSIRRFIRKSYQNIHLRGPNGDVLLDRLLVTPLTLDDEVLHVFKACGFKRERTLVPTGQKETFLSTATLCNELNKARARLCLMEEKLKERLIRTDKHLQTFSEDVTAIHMALVQVSQSLLSQQWPQERSQLCVVVMNLCIDYWREATNTDKFELARRSGLWSVYTNPDGWERTQTLDKYLFVKTLPKRPRWAQVLATADFVLTSCANKTPALRRQHLEETLARFMASFHHETNQGENRI